jgi:hypothetical protein
MTQIYNAPREAKLRYSQTDKYRYVPCMKDVRDPLKYRYQNVLRGFLEEEGIVERQ